MKEVTGNILRLAGQGEFDLIVHGCNCEGIMGAGLAKQISEEYPAAKDADQNSSGITPDQKLGGVVGVTVYSNENPAVVFTILNGYTQRNARGARGEVLVDYDAVRSVFRTVGNNYPNYRIAYPKIGAGKAHGDWDTIKAIIDEELDGLDHTLVVFDGK
jgi:O-acetyl-ADP-ribose deacetylase (regulator of RNase III)